MPGYISDSKTQQNVQKFLIEEEVDQYTRTIPYSSSSSEEEEEEIIRWRPKQLRKKPNKKTPQKVCLEGYVEPSNDDVLPRTKSLTDDDLDELKGCVDLGFGFSYDEIPELCNTLPALELCYSMSQKFLDDHHSNQQNVGGNGDTVSFSGSENSSHMPTWKISSPGDNPEDVKARLKFWAQAVACTVKLCSSSS